MTGIDDVNRHPIIHTWSYKLAEVIGWHTPELQSGFCSITLTRLSPAGVTVATTSAGVVRAIWPNMAVDLLQIDLFGPPLTNVVITAVGNIMRSGTKATSIYSPSRYPIPRSV